jgi:hypothetical protein
MPLMSPNVHAREQVCGTQRADQLEKDPAVIHPFLYGGDPPDDVA